MDRIRYIFFLTLIIVAATSCTTTKPQTSLATIGDGVSRRDARVDHLHPGHAVEVGLFEGPGVVRQMWFTTQSDDEDIYADLILRVWWDDDSEPAIEVPMGEFFGVGFGEERLVRSAAVEMIPAGLPGHAALTCWLSMPFEKARFTVENTSDTEAILFHIINWEEVDSVAGEGRLQTQVHRSTPVTKGRHHTVLAERGRGHFVGMVYSVKRLGPGAWVEGGEDFYIDIRDDEWAALENWDRSLVKPDRAVPEDERSVANQPMGPVYPTLPGIGGEDYFSMSWGYRVEDRSLYHGVSLGPDDPEDRMTAYRFHILDPIRFKENIRVHFRNHGWDVQAREDEIHTVAFYYLEE